MNHVVLTKEQQVELAKKKHLKEVQNAHRKYNNNSEKIELLLAELAKIKGIPHPHQVTFSGYPNSTIITFSQQNLIALFESEIELLNAENKQLGSFIYR
jgi:hypothetical protein